jgi:hypothetical protein
VSISNKKYNLNNTKGIEMKKILIGLLALGTLSAFGSDYFCQTKNGSEFKIIVSTNDFTISDIILDRDNGVVEDFKAMYNDEEVQKNNRKKVSKSFKQPPLGRQEIQFYKSKKILKVKEYTLNLIPKTIFEASCD